MARGGRPSVARPGRLASVPAPPPALHSLMQGDNGKPCPRESGKGNGPARRPEHKAPGPRGWAVWTTGRCELTSGRGGPSGRRADRPWARLPFPRVPCLRSHSPSCESSMARDQVDMTPIDSRDELVAWFEPGCKPKSRIPHRHRTREVRRSRRGHRPVPMTARAASVRCSTACSTCSAGSRSWRRQHHRTCRCDRRRRDLARAGRAVRTVRRAGRDLHQTCRELIAHLAQVREIARAARHRLPRHRRARPKWTRAETPKMPKARYES